ncbi:MAG TPA: PEP-CTERM sorting domain-containing protein [Gemmatimonas aurantiaca]|uniref:Ice-binding protein C-terminal domain-containing protein n=2 Tax=Gemmatimonas aurantiaca TaxID=173480 RepID=C1A3I5_GEMAT|nr:PEP-CTERM sorting domain-containing protein [Gemmatimonas aurantiaca]BAH37062.1 hypothetical protein GAU_0020 [Gemmatimonas aurantiaca T-27]HCT58906.1 PEP-CTERM sorting domain-containing protein [Gemmatimonas aurantiaca]
MNRWMRSAAVGVAILTARVADAQPYNFLVDYTGGNTPVLAPGSDPMIGTNLQVGDSFFWRISAIGGQWSTTAAVSQYTFMAFYVSEYGTRTGDYTLNLFLNGSTVFTETQSNVVTEYIHVGTNTVNLPAGFSWDRMELHYTLNGSNVSSNTIGSRLPIFGAPEHHQYSPGVTYATNVVPEPATVVLLAIGLGVMGVAVRRRAS